MPNAVDSDYYDPIDGKPSIHNTPPLFILFAKETYLDIVGEHYIRISSSNYDELVQLCNDHARATDKHHHVYILIDPEELWAVAIEELLNKLVKDTTNVVGVRSVSTTPPIHYKLPRDVK